MKRFMLMLLAIVLIIGLIPAAASAQYIEVIHSETVRSDAIQTASVDTDVPKERLIERIHELFPGKFSHIKDEEFQRDRVMYRYENEIPTHSIYFNHRLNHRLYQSGSFTFVGEDLELQYFNYRPEDNAGAFYPPLVSREEAGTIAAEFVAELFPNQNYHLAQDEPFPYYGFSRRLTDPVEYEFRFDLLHQGVPVNGAQISLAVRGDGEVIRFSRGGHALGELAYEQKIDLLDEQEVLEQIIEQIDLELVYMMDRYNPNQQHVHLAYRPKRSIDGMHAINGKWYLNGAFEDELGEQVSGYTFVTDQPLEVKGPMTAQQARQIANRLLQPQDDGVTLNIHQVDEREYSGSRIISVHYMYEQGGTGVGSTMEFDQETGDVLSFSSHREIGYRVDQERLEPKLSYEQALEKAVEALKEYAPSIAHKYVLPQSEAGPDHYNGAYYFSFMRVENGIPFVGDNVSVGVSSQDGEIMHFSTRYRYTGDLPDVGNVVSAEEAKESYVEKLDLNLRYTLSYSEEEPEQFYLVYMLEPVHYFEYLDAKTGEWKRFEGAPSTGGATVAHPFATEELNYLVEAGILSVDEDFDPEASITKGQALDILIRSTTYHMVMYYPQQDLKPTFDNIDPAHPLFNVVERAVEMGILNQRQSTFAVDDPLTKEELASWLIKVLRLEHAAQHSDIYKLDFADAERIDPALRGHVALLAAYGILTGNEQGFYQPKSEMTLAQMATATFRLANVLTAIQHESRYWY